MFTLLFVLFSCMVFLTLGGVIIFGAIILGIIDSTSEQRDALPILIPLCLLIIVWYSFIAHHVANTADCKHCVEAVYKDTGKVDRWLYDKVWNPITSPIARYNDMLWSGRWTWPNIGWVAPSILPFAVGYFLARYLYRDKNVR